MGESRARRRDQGRVMNAPYAEQVQADAVTSDIARYVMEYEVED